MKISEQQIIDSARRQRSQAQEQVHVRPWTDGRRRVQMPLWLAAVPAAAVGGFLLGAAIRQPQPPTPSLTAVADTVYIDREVPMPQRPDTVVRYVHRPAPKRQTAAMPAGRSVAQDNIDYSMLVLK